MSKMSSIDSTVSTPIGGRPKSSRPHSTPANRYRVTYSARNQQRPKTAALLVQECERLGRVEGESVRQHRFRSHLPTRREKSAPWQAQLEFERLPHNEANMLLANGTQKPVHIAPGYILSRSKSKYQMIINDKFFEKEEQKAKERNQANLDPELEQLIDTLKQQVADLSLYLEEERLNHKDTKKKAEEFLKDKVEEMKRDQKESIRRLTDEHDLSMSSIITSHKQELAELTYSYDDVIAKHKTEIAFLQGAFESYKGQSNEENQRRIEELRDDLERSHVQDLQTQLNELGKKLTNEKNAALAAASREHNKKVNAIEKQCAKEIDALNRRFSNHAADVRKLKEAEIREKELTSKYEDMVSRNTACEKNVVNLTRAVEDYKAKLAVYERDFNEKVEEVDSRYKIQMAELREQNTELRKQYMKKCDQLFSTTALVDSQQKASTQTSKETMMALIQSRSNAYVNIAASDPSLKHTVPKERPCSAPATKREERKAAMSAGETQEFLARKEVPFVRPQSVLELSAVFDTSELNRLTEEELETGLQIAAD
ncbi:ALS2CR12 [Bugula neritina]|uniref:ALS2CR12 n=1 Tax=Bugula neritina TaxID=10212 RepID=A0A7J7JG48_BUGNE|nr:ALS2CR12 [Bugula neritina]